MRLLFLEQSDHLAGHTKATLQQLCGDKMQVNHATDINTLDYDAIFWTAGALSLEDAATTAAKLSNYKGPLLAVGMASMALAQHWGGQVGPRQTSQRYERLFQLNVVESCLRSLPRESDVPLLIPQYQIERLPNVLVALGKTAAGLPLAWKHRSNKHQGLLMHPCTALWQPQGEQILSDWLAPLTTNNKSTN